MSQSHQDRIDYPIHELALIFPPLGPEDFSGLVESIRTSGLISPITLWDDGNGAAIIDGRNRYLACREARERPIFSHFTGSREDAVRFVCEQNLRRRHLSESQRAMAARDLIKAGLPSEIAATVMRISARSVTSANTVGEFGHQNVADLVRSGDMAVSTAAKLVKNMPKSAQANIKTPGDAKRITDEIHTGSSLQEKRARKLEKAVALLKGLAPYSDQVASYFDDSELFDLRVEVNEAHDALNRIRDRLGVRRPPLAVAR